MKVSGRRKFLNEFHSKFQLICIHVELVLVNFLQILLEIVNPRISLEFFVFLTVRFCKFNGSARLMTRGCGLKAFKSFRMFCFQLFVIFRVLSLLRFYSVKGHVAKMCSCLKLKEKSFEFCKLCTK